MCFLSRSCFPEHLQSWLPRRSIGKAWGARAVVQGMCEVQTDKPHLPSGCWVPGDAAVHISWEDTAQHSPGCSVSQDHIAFRQMPLVSEWF